MLMRFSCLLAILPASMAAEFDKCARANALWAGFDQACSRSLVRSKRVTKPSVVRAQGVGLSEAHAVAYSNGNIYMAGYACALPSLSSRSSDPRLSPPVSQHATHRTPLTARH